MTGEQLYPTTDPGAVSSLLGQGCITRRTRVQAANLKSASVFKYCKTDPLNRCHDTIVRKNKLLTHPPQPHIFIYNPYCSPILIPLTN